MISGLVILHLMLHEVPMIIAGAISIWGTPKAVKRIMVTHTDKRIAKLLKQGVACLSIAKKIGRPGDIERVHRIGCNCK